MGEQGFEGFSDDALYLQRFLHDERWTRDSWDEVSREIYSEEIKPQLQLFPADGWGHCFETVLVERIGHDPPGKISLFPLRISEHNCN